MKLWGVLVACVMLIGCTAVAAEDVRAPVPESPVLAHVETGAITPLPRTIALDPHKVALGERLFADRRLSGDGKVACTDCHSFALGGANGQARSVLPDRKPVKVNVPTVFNVAFDFRYAWNGRYEEIEDQLDFAMNSPAAMGGTWAAAVKAVAGDRGYAHAFASAYRDGLSEHALRDALVVYCRSLITPDSRFDRSLRGELALAPDERRGYETFREYGCISCHQGRNVGGNLYQRFGVMLDYFALRGDVRPEDLGRYSVTKQERDRHVFRVPSLRNVEKTAPYFHDGSALTLQDAIETMAHFQLGRDLSAEQTEDIVAFLRTLTGEYRGRRL